MYEQFHLVSLVLLFLTISLVSIETPLLDDHFGKMDWVSI